MRHLIVFKKFVYEFLDKPKKETSKLVKNKMKYGEFWSVFYSVLPQWCHKGLMVKSRENWCTLVLITINHSFICICSNYAGVVVTIFLPVSNILWCFFSGAIIDSTQHDFKKIHIEAKFLEFFWFSDASITSQFGANWILLAALVFNSRRHALAVLACTPLLTSFNHDFIDPAFHVNIMKVT